MKSLPMETNIEASISPVAFTEGESTIGPMDPTMMATSVRVTVKVRESGSQVEREVTYT